MEELGHLVTNLNANEVVEIGNIKIWMDRRGRKIILHVLCLKSIKIVKTGAFALNGKPNFTVDTDAVGS